MPLEIRRRCVAKTTLNAHALLEPLNSHSLRSPSRAGNVLVLSGATVPALEVDTIGVAAENVIVTAPAGWLPIKSVRIRRHQEPGRLERAQTAWTWDRSVVARSTKSAANVLPVSLAPQIRLQARLVPVKRMFRLIIEAAGIRRNDCVGLRWAEHSAVVRELATESALLVSTIRETAQTAQAAVSIPVVRKIRRIVKFTPSGRAVNLGVITAATESAFRMYAISEAAERRRILHTGLVPEVLHFRFIVKFAVRAEHRSP